MKPSSVPAFAIVGVTRTIVDDDHFDPTGPRPSTGIGKTGKDEVILPDYGGRPEATRPLIRTYAARIAVPRDHAASWDLALGDDYHVLITTTGFTAEADGRVTIAGKRSSNYLVQLPGASGGVGPNAAGFVAMPVGVAVPLQVLGDEVKGRIFREFETLTIASLTNEPPPDAGRGIDEDADAQARRWRDWKPITKPGLR